MEKGVEKDQMENLQILISSEKPVDYWCRKLDCGKNDLMHALSTVGSSYTIVDYFLVLNRKKNS